MAELPAWVQPRQAAADGAADSVIAKSSRCQQAFNLPAGGIIMLPSGEVVTLSSDATFRPSCGPTTGPNIIAGTGGSADFADIVGGSGISVSDPTDGELSNDFSNFYDPFYASTFPQCYALAATTVVAYTLVIMLFVTPRSFLDGGVVVLGRRGFTHGGSSGTSIGGRPWLQKVAALTVAISLTIASVDTFNVAEYQYSHSIQNARTLQRIVLGGTELKVIRLISSTFLWLAQAQTLIRLFPRHREKVIIKWTAFSLITLDVIFDGLNSFLYTNEGSFRPKSFNDAVPALSYLFQLTLGVLYAAWVIYYSLMKKQYAFYHPQMRNMCLVAVLSVLSLVIPIVFFVLDIAKSDFAGWGDYVRWVGAAAASVIVWEWVERIEALEREERKGGILGREVFDGDEGLDGTPGESTWPKRRRYRSEKADDDGESGNSGSGGRSGGSGSTTAVSSSAPTAKSKKSKLWPLGSAIANRYRSTAQADAPKGATGTAPRQPAGGDASPTGVAQPQTQPPLWPSRPAPAVTPVSRTDTASADSTVYAVRYHPLTETTSRTTEVRTPPPASTPAPAPAPPPPPSRNASSASSHHESDGARNMAEVTTLEEQPTASAATSSTRWRTLAQAMPFRRDTTSTPVQPPEAGRAEDREPDRPRRTESAKWDVRSRFEDFAASQAEKIREKIRPTVDTANLPVMVIPAPARRGTALAQVLEEEESNQRRDHAAARVGDLPLAQSPDAQVRRDSYLSVHSRPAPHAGGSASSASPPSATPPAPRRQHSDP